MKAANSPGVDLVLVSASGQELPVTVRADVDDPPGPGINVMAKDILRKDLIQAFEAFGTITEAAGYGRQPPFTPRNFNLGDPRKKSAKAIKVNPVEHAELLGMRWTEARRVPTSPDLPNWEQEIARMTRSNYSKSSRRVLKDYGVEFEDIQTYVRVWVNTYLGLFYRHSLTRQDNANIMSRQVKQRYNDVFKNHESVFGRKQKSFQAHDDFETAMIGTLSRVSSGNFRAGAGGPRPLPEVYDDGIDVNYIQRHGGLKPRDEARKAAIARLMALTCTEVRELLGPTALDPRHVDPEAVEIAREYLAKHVATCKKCIVPVGRQPSIRVPVTKQDNAPAILAAKEKYIEEVTGKTKVCRHCHVAKDILENFGIWYRKQLKVPHWALQNRCYDCRAKRKT